MAGLYIHIPYCRRRCIYCDFYSVGSARAPWTQYVGQLLAELEVRQSELSQPFNTVYIGGGTPSQMPVTELSRLVEGVKTILGERYSPTEFTLEANPEDITLQYLSVLTDLGVNRLSIGMQSLQDTELANVGRRHNATQAVEAYLLAKQHIPNISVDLMFGLPGQSMPSWQDTIRQTLELHPTHVSAYALMREPGTPLDIMLRQKRIDTPADDTTAEMYSILSSTLKEAGYRHYEISNYALPGYESQHNRSYWQSAPYLGIGAAAHSYDGQRTRRANLPDVKYYLEATAGEVPHQTEKLSDIELQEEYIMTRMRTSDGIDLTEAADRLGAPTAAKIDQRCRRYIATNKSRLLRATPSGYTLTDQGIMLSDAVISAIGFSD